VHLICTAKKHIFSFVNIFNVLYLLLLVISLLLSIRSFKYHKSFKLLPYLLSLSLLTEVIVYSMYYIFDLQRSYKIIYHIYLPIEYVFFAYFFYLNFNNRTLKKLTIASIVFVVLLSLILSLVINSLYIFPGENFNLVGSGLILLSIIALFNLQPINDLPFYKLPLFWICFGILFFYSGMFFFNEVYEYLMNSEPDLAEKLNYYINKSLNCLLYVCFSIAFICSHQMKKYT